MIINYFSRIILVMILFCIMSINTLLAQQSMQTIKIGIYDSRAVAIAYANSDLFQKQIESLMTEFKKAKEENKSARLNELEKEGPFQQQLLHQQTFSVGTISNIMDKIKDKLQNVAKNSGVNLIISKWELVYKDSSLEYVDVTAQLVNLFKPSTQTLKWIESIKTQNPIPIDKLSMDPIK